MAYLIDANVLCETSKLRPDAGVVRWLGNHDSRLRVCAVSLGEMVKGIHLMDQGKRRREIESWYQRIERWSAGRIVVFDAGVMNTWGRYYAKHQRDGRKLPLLDSFLAAAAIYHQLTLVTRNERDFPDDVSVLNPWTNGSAGSEFSD